MFVIFSLAFCTAKLSVTSSGGEHILSARQRLPMPQWLAMQNQAESFLLQVGANDHTSLRPNGYDGRHDPGPACVARGWRAVLLEPIASTFDVLQQHYSSLPNSRVKLKQAAICSSCEMQCTDMFRLDLSNRTGNWGSKHADGRCAVITNESGWISEISSLSRKHLLDHAGLYNWMPRECKQCARVLEKTLSPNCMKRLVQDNLVVEKVHCACLSNIASTQRTVTLLFIDAEGHDVDVLFKYPFGLVPTARVAFEAIHLSNSAWRSAVKLLHDHRFESIDAHPGGQVLSTWHNVSWV